ncbi:MAG: AmmeMemoRadiSam system protein B [Epsilonproteobacteria bacterium]|nr:AmmeMemoRadiSam system protein B [Campylobacterota bacterium]
MREMANVGFYPQECNEVERFIEYFNEILDKNIDQANKDRLFKLKPKAVIVPHAGWPYSGFSANFVYRMCKNFSKKRVIVIGPSHKVAFSGASVLLEEGYQTPCKTLQVDKQYSQTLIDKFGFAYLPQAHQEHSTEVQMPFVAHYIKEPLVVEVVYSECDAMKLHEMINYAINDDNLVVISTDLSHYYNKAVAMQLDYNCLEAVYDLDITKLAKCEACGKIGLEAIIRSADELGLSSLVVDYRTSSDATNDETNVVGYMSAIFI